MQQRNSTGGEGARADAPAGGAPALITSLAWPPLIHPSRVPMLARGRDLLLTLLAWLVFVVVLRRPIVNAVDWISPTLGSRLREFIPIDYAVDASPFLWIAGGLVIFLMLNGIRRRHYLRRVPGAEHEVPPLPPQVQFGGAGVPIEQMGGWRDARCLHVRLGGDGTMALVEPPSPGGLRS